MVLVMMAMMIMAGCSSIDCPLNNTTYTKYKLMGNITTLADTMTISTTKTEGQDSILINRDVNVDSFILPMNPNTCIGFFPKLLRNQRVIRSR